MTLYDEYEVCGRFFLFVFFLFTDKLYHTKWYRVQPDTFGSGTSNISGESHRSERFPYHTIVTKAAMTSQNEVILKCYYILIFLGVQLILINRNTQ